LNNAQFDLSGKTALVTGASRGLGQMIAVALAKAGARLCITARSAAALEATGEEISRLGQPCFTAVQDVRNVESIKQTVTRFRHDAGEVDILVNNAGFEHLCPSLQVDEAIWDAIVDTNLKGAFFWSQALAQEWVAQKRGGSIVNLCSLTSFVGIPMAAPYGSSKSGLLGMTRALATEWASLGIRVNAIAPGYFRTAMTEPFYQDENWQQAMLAKIPQQRFGQTSDIGAVVVFLCSPAAAYVTGHCIPVDGGFLASI